MGFDLGLAAQAYRGVQDEQKRLRDEQFLQANRDYQLANMNAEASLRDQRVANARKTLDLQGLQTDSSIGLQPGEARLARTRQGTEQIAAEGAQTIQPTLNATAKQKAETGLVDAGTARVRSETDRKGAIAEHEDKARLIEHAVATGQADTEAIRDSMFGHLYGEHPDGDFSGSVKRLQFAADKMPLTFSELAGQTIGSAKSETDANGNKMLVVRNKKGQVLMSRSAAQMASAYAGQGKTQVLKDGDSLVQINGGRVTPMAENTKDFALGRGGAAGRGPGGVKGELIKMMMDDAKAQGKTMTVEEAWHAIQANPERAAGRMAELDYRLLDPKTTAAERMRIMNEHRAEFGLGPTAGSAPGAVDPAVQAQINAAIGRR